MADALVPYAGDQLSRVTSWTNLAADERRRRAMAAARDRDADVLTDLALCWLTLHGKAGAKRSQHTTDAYRRAIAVLFHEWRDQNLLHVAPDAASLMCRRWETAGLSASTITVRLAGARTLYKALRWAGATQTDPLADVRPARDPTPAWSKRKPFADADITKLLSVATPSDRVLVLLGAHAGLRVSEIVGLEWRDIDLDHRILTVVNGKGGKRRMCPLSSSLCTALHELWPGGRYVLPYRSTKQARNRLRRLCQKAGVSYLSPHSLRHSCGTRIYRETGKLERAQVILGHADISTTMIYTHFADDEVARTVADW